MKTFIAPAPAPFPRRGRLYVGSHVVPASQEILAFAGAARATVASLSRCNSVRARFAANAIFAGHLAGPTTDPIASNVMARPLTPTAVQGQDAGMTQSPDALPDRLRDVEHLEEVMTTPSAALIAALQELAGDIIILG